MPLLKTSESSASEESGPFWNPDTKAGLLVGSAVGAASPSASKAAAAWLFGKLFGVDRKRLSDVLGGMSLNDFKDVMAEDPMALADLGRLEARFAGKSLPRRLAAVASWAVPSSLLLGASGAYAGSLRDGDESPYENAGKAALAGGAFGALPVAAMSMSRGGEPLRYLDPLDALRLAFDRGRGVDEAGKARAWNEAGKAGKALRHAANVGKWALPVAAAAGTSALAGEALHRGARSLFEENEK